MRLLELGCVEPNDPERLTAASRDGWWAEVRGHACIRTGKRVQKIGNRVIGFARPDQEEIYGSESESWCEFVWEGPIT